MVLDSWRADQVLSSRVRMEVIQTLLSEGEMHISDLERRTRKPWGTIAYHLGLLENAGIVRSEYRLGKHHSKAPVKRFYWVQRAKLQEYLRAWEKLPKAMLRQARE